MDDTGSSASDLSSFNLDGTFTGTRITDLVPITTGCLTATSISSSSYATYPEITDIGTSGNDYNAFSIEFWFKPNDLGSTTIMPIVADSVEGIGVFWDKTSLVFDVSHTNIRYHVPNPNKVIHVVAVYSINSIQLYVDGLIVSTVQTSSDKFTADSITLKSQATSGTFLINCVSLYKYSLSGNRIYVHYVYGSGMPALQVVAPNNGHLFEIFDNGISKQYSYSYPGNKSFSYFASDLLEYDEVKKSLKITTENGDIQSVSFDDVISIPSGLTIDDSYIEWDGGELVTVETSIDGETYVECVNGRSIPQYIIGDVGFSDERILYIRVTLSTSDDSKYNPEITYLTMRFYNDQKIYATNYPSYLSKIEDDSNVTSLEVDLGSKLYPILSRNDLNGVKTVQDSGFYITTDMLVNTLEFFYTPYALTDSGLVSAVADTNYFAANYSWRNSGTISKSNISAIYVNGVDKVSETSVSNVFKTGQLHHVVIVFTQPISNVIKFNHSLYGAVEALYQNIATYEDQFSLEDTQDHYNAYTGNSLVLVEDATITLTESPVKAYNNDWIVVQNV
jgi:hypothetical protein